MGQSGLFTNVSINSIKQRIHYIWENESFGSSDNLAVKKILFIDTYNLPLWTFFPSMSLIFFLNYGTHVNKYG